MVMVMFYIQMMLCNKMLLLNNVMIKILKIMMDVQINVKLKIIGHALQIKKINLYVIMLIKHI